MFGIEDFSKPLIDYSNFDFSQLKDVLVFGGSVVLIGMATIFAVLTILWAFLAVFKLVFKNADKKVLLCDSTKFNRSSLYTLTSLDSVDHAVFDKDFDGLVTKTNII